MQSIIKDLGGVIEMPEFKARNLYMHKSRMDDLRLPDQFSDFKAPIEKALGKLQDLNNVCYITIDEKHITGETHRRPGIHVDFNWYEAINAHAPAHRPSGRQPFIGMHRGGPTEGGHERDHDETGGLLLMSNHEGCRVWKGEFSGEILEGGDCSLIDTTGLESEVIPAGHVYFLNPLGIHESIKIDTDVYRTLIRINFHPEYDFKAA